MMTEAMKDACSWNKSYDKPQQHIKKQRHNFADKGPDSQCQSSLVAQMVTNMLAVQEAWVRSLGQEDPLKKGMVTHSSILDWRIPWNLAGYSPWGCKKWDMTEELTL